MQFNGYHHVGLRVADEARSLKFYTEGLGGKETLSFPIAGTESTIHLIDLGGGAVVEIIPRGQDGEEANARWAHIAVATNDTRAAYALALKAGAKSKSEPTDMQLGPVAACTAFVFGPDDETIEFFQTK